MHKECFFSIVSCLIASKCLFVILNTFSENVLENNNFSTAYIEFQPVFLFTVQLLITFFRDNNRI